MTPGYQPERPVANRIRGVVMRALGLLDVLLIATVLPAGCTVTSEKPVFGPEETVKMERFQGEYFLYDPWDKDFNKEVVASVRDGELEIVNVVDCREREKCFWRAVVVRLPTSKESYAVQLPLNDNDEEVFFTFVQAIKDYGIACIGIDEDWYKQHTDLIKNIVAASGLEVASRKYNPVFITGSPEPEHVLQFLDEVWSKVPREAWSCFGLIPDGKPVDGIREILNRTAYGAAGEG